MSKCKILIFLLLLFLSGSFAAPSRVAAIVAIEISDRHIGYQHALPGENDVSLFAFRIENNLLIEKYLESITVRNVSKIKGSTLDGFSNLDSISLYIDFDGDVLYSPGDSLLGKFPFDSSIIFFPIDSLLFPIESKINFLFTGDISDYPRDSDSLDFELWKLSDVFMGAGTVLIGNDTINSFGEIIIDGMIANQISVAPIGNTFITPQDSFRNILTVSIPRNGYEADSLKMFSVENFGSLPSDGIDSLLLYVDNGDNVWTSFETENYIGKLIFTGSRWVRSGLSVPLIDSMTMFHVALELSEFPLNSATVSLGIPLNGLEVGSSNDGPIDIQLDAVDTFTIVSYEVVEIQALSISPKEIVPGDPSAAIFGLEITNSYSNVIGLDSLRLRLISEDFKPSSQELLDSQIDSVLIFLNLGGEMGVAAISDSLIGSGRLVNGSVLIDLYSVPIGGFGGNLLLTVAAAVNLEKARNGNNLNLAIDDSAGLYFSPTVLLESAFPLQNEIDHTIVSFPAERIKINAPGGSNIYSGQVNQPVLEFTVPSNGYDADVLRKIELQNIGSLNEKEAISLLKLWIDLTGDGFTADDPLIGIFSENVNGWIMDALFMKVDTSGEDLIVTADIALNISQAGTFQLQIPTKTLFYWSGLDGPDDMAVTNSSPHLVFPSNAVTMISIPNSTQLIYPGSSANNLTSFAMYNGYTDPGQTLQSITLTNVSRSKVSLAYSGYELGQISIYFDSNNNRVFDESDELLTTASFFDSTLQLSGLNRDLPNEEISFFFVVNNIPLGVTDSDSLAVAINNISDISFSTEVVINGDFPLFSGGYLLIDGSVKRQYTQASIPSQSLSPGDSNQVLFAFKPPSNGILTDTLNTLFLANLGTADTADISTLELWKDLNQDTRYQATDSLLGLFSFVNGVWVINSLNLEIDTQSVILMVVGDISLTAQPGSSFRAVLPVNGCQFLSENDGPIDSPIIGTGIFLISSSGLRVNYTPLNETYSVGQPIELRFTVTNITFAALDSIYGLINNYIDTTILVLDSSSSGPVTLNSGESIEFVYYYRGISPGVISWDLLAVATVVNDSSAIVSTETVTIQISPSQVQVQFINSVPASVAKGQINVFPLSLNIIHPDSLQTTATIRLDSIILNVDNGSDSLVKANDVFSRMVLSSGDNNLSILNTVPAESSVVFIFSEPLYVHPSETQSLILFVDISDSASVSDFRLLVENAQAINLTDKNTSGSVNLDSTLVFPMATASCRIDTPSQNMVLAYQPIFSSYVNYGQTDVRMAQLNLRHPGFSGSSQIQLTSLSIQFLDELSNPADPSNLFDRVIIKRQQSIIAELTNLVSQTTPLDIALNAPLTLNPQQEDSITIEVWMQNSSPYIQFGLNILDSNSFVVRDLSSGLLLITSTDTTKLATGSVFPINSGLATLKQPAQQLATCVTSNLPSSIVGGSDGLDLISFNFSYPYPNEYSPVIVSEVLIQVYDSLGSPLNPSLLFDKIGYRLSSGVINYQSFVELQGGAALFKIGGSGIVLNPGDSIDMTLSADIESDAPYDHFILELQNNNDITIIDQTDTASSKTFYINSGCPATLPFTTLATSIFLPAGRPLYNNNSSTVEITYGGESDVIVLTGEISYQGASPVGDVVINSIIAGMKERTATTVVAVNSALVFETVSLYLDNNLVAVDSILSGDSVKLIIPLGYPISLGASESIELKAKMKNNAKEGNYFLEFADSSFIDLYDKNLLNSIFVLAGNYTYPFLSAELSVTSLGLENSYTNFPNPFNPNGGSTVIGFVLDEDANIDIELFTITGEKVLSLVNNSFRAAGVHKSDRWNAINSSGQTVHPGTYYCRITARYLSGKIESFNRKIAVVR